MEKEQEQLQLQIQLDMFAINTKVQLMHLAKDVFAVGKEKDSVESVFTTYDKMVEKVFGKPEVKKVEPEV